MKTLVIASEDEFVASKRRLNAIGLDDIERVNPVSTEDKCVNNTTGETGCFRAHKDAWRRCSEQNDERCLVLERDWTYGDQNPEHVKNELQNLPTAFDFYLVGNCGYVFCSHAYTITKQHAKELSTVNECEVKMPLDHFMNKRCRNKTTTCDMYHKKNMPGCFGHGLIQQNRKDFNGLHDEFNKIKA